MILLAVVAHSGSGTPNPGEPEKQSGVLQGPLGVGTPVLLPNEEQVRLYQTISYDYQVAGKMVTHPRNNAGAELEMLSHSSTRAVRETAKAFLQQVLLATKAQQIIQNLTESGSSYAIKMLTDDSSREERARKENAAYEATQAKIDEFFQCQLETLDYASQGLQALLRDTQRAKRNTVDVKSFDISCGLDNQAGSAVRLRNGTGVSLHNCLIFCSVSADTGKLDAEKKRQQPGVLRGTTVARTQLISNPMTFIEFWQVTSKTYWLMMRKEQATFFFVPDWKDGDMVEFTVLPQMGKMFAGSARIVILTDEGEIKSIDLSAQQLLGDKS